MADPGDIPAAERLNWSRGMSLTTRILAVNIVALGLLAGSLFYLDSYRKQLLAERYRLARAEAEIAADALDVASRRQRREIVALIGVEQGLRVRLYDRTGTLIADSFTLAEPSYALVDPDSEGWYQHSARLLDRGVDFIVGAQPIEFYNEPESRKIAAWPELVEARDHKVTVVRQRLAPDLTPMITAATPVGKRGYTLLTTRNARDITQAVRDARRTLAIVVGAALGISILLSLFLARTIIQPLRTLVRAAIRVRLGRDREVVVPRLPERGDEIGLLARAISDMTAALRQRIDAVESFAADVAHELKNPLASLRSALESLDKVEDPALRQQLSDIAAHDIKRIDRLVTEIADASRIDAELSRTKFEPVDLLRLVTALVAEREQRGVNATCLVTVAARGEGEALVAGDAHRMQRVFDNLLDNAVSFSDPGGGIEVNVDRGHERVRVSVCDHGPGIAPDAREKVFERFHSLRPDAEDFGSHSGLGLAIARTIIEAHDGTLTAHDRRDGARGARLVVDLPAWQSAP